MKRLRYALLAAAVIAAGTNLSYAQGGHDHAGHDHAGHDHGSEPRGQAAPETDSPPAPPSDFDVPESRPLESSPSTNGRDLNFGQPSISRPLRDERDFEPQPRDFVPESRPSRNIPPRDGRTPYSRPTPHQLPSRDWQEFESAPQDFAPQSACPSERDSQGPCPSGRDGWVCPRQQAFAPAQPCPLGHTSTYECPWERNQRLGMSFDEFAPPARPTFPAAIPEACPTGACGHSHGESEDWNNEPLDRRPEIPADRSAPFFGDEPNTSPPPTFQSRSSERPRFLDR